MKAHAEGKTEEAKADKARLELIRARRAAQAKRAQQEQEAVERRKKQNAAADSSSDEELEQLDSRAIKKMNPSKLKEELKKRGLNIQGNKKQLQKRLLDACK